jgi:hypothetical protein
VPAGSGASSVHPRRPEASIEPYPSGVSYLARDLGDRPGNQEPLVGPAGDGSADDHTIGVRHRRWCRAEPSVLGPGRIGEGDAGQWKPDAVRSANDLNPSPAIETNRRNLGCYHDPASRIRRGPGSRQHRQARSVGKLQFSLSRGAHGETDADRLPAFEHRSRTWREGRGVDDKRSCGWDRQWLWGESDAVLGPHSVGSLRHFEVVDAGRLGLNWNREPGQEAPVWLYVDDSTVYPKRGGSAANGSKDEIGIARSDLCTGRRVNHAQRNWPYHIRYRG